MAEPNREMLRSAILIVWGIAVNIIAVGCKKRNSAALAKPRKRRSGRLWPPRTVKGPKRRVLNGD
jgi:hypothetical protein